MPERYRRGVSASPEPTPADTGRINLIVLFGGQSAEHDVSCVTASHVLAAVDPEKYDVTPVGIARDGRWALSAEAMHALSSGLDKLPAALDPAGEEISPAAVVKRGAARSVVLPLLHGPMGEDGTVQGLMELADLPFVGSGVLSSSLCMDKAMQKVVTGAAGVPQARSRALRETDRHDGLAAEVAEELGLPLFVKPANMGSSVGVSKAHDIAEVGKALELAFSYDEWVLAEEAVLGREIEVAVLGNDSPEASAPGEIVPGEEFYSYEDKYAAGAASQTLVPAPLTPGQAEEVRELALQSFRALRCDGLARVDFFFEEEGRGFLLNEVNTMPGFTPISMFPKLWMATGMSYSELIDRLVQLALDRHRRRRRNTAH